MECPHLSESIKIDRLFVRNKIKNSKGLPKSSFKCLECASEKENWLCLNCGKVLCGRYVNSHALQHSSQSSESQSNHHRLCMHTLNQSVFCYKCDDFVINDTIQLDELRRELQTLEESDEAASTTTSTSSGSNSSSSTSTCNSISSNKSSTTGSRDSGWADDPMPPHSLGRRLRPRKRTISSDSNHEGAATTTTTTNHKESVTSSSSSAANATTAASAANTPTPSKRSKSAGLGIKLTKRVVGLRNLGNTCFMNSVLQSLGNIQEFSSYFYSLPSMEQIKQQRKSSGKGGSSSYVSSSSSAASLSGHSGGGLNGTSLGGGLSQRELEDANVVEELRKVLLNLGQGGDGSKAISPECLFLVIWKVVPQFRGHRQHDAHEFLRYMLDRLHTELQQIAWPSPAALLSSVVTDGSRLKAGILGGGGGATGAATANGGGVSAVLPGSGGGGANGNMDMGSNNYGGSKRGSIVTNVFGGVLQSEVRCLICGMESKKHDPFLDLSLDIPEKFYSKEAAATATTATNSSTGGGGGAEDEDKPVCHISDCLSSFTEVEELAETELYYCNSCKCKQKSTKRFWIRRLPNVLCLHIKRFRWSNFFRTKIDLRISFPLKALDMSQFVLNNGPETRRSNSTNNVYDLAAVIVHHGNGSSCGHYTSYAYSSGTWLHFNDHTVKEVSVSTVADCKPYILFYTRRDQTSCGAAGGVKSSASPSSTLS